MPNYGGAGARERPHAVHVVAWCAPLVARRWWAAAGRCPATAKLVVW